MISLTSIYSIIYLGHHPILHTAGLGFDSQICKHWTNALKAAECRGNLDQRLNAQKCLLEI